MVHWLRFLQLDLQVVSYDLGPQFSAADFYIFCSVLRHWKIVYWRCGNSAVSSKINVLNVQKMQSCCNNFDLVENSFTHVVTHHNIKQLFIMWSRQSLSCHSKLRQVMTRWLDNESVCDTRLIEGCTLLEDEDESTLLLTYMWLQCTTASVA